MGVEAIQCPYQVESRGLSIPFANSTNDNLRVGLVVWETGWASEVKFVIEGRLPGLNEIVNTARYNRYAGASQKKKETRRCALEIIRQTTGQINVPFRLRINWIERDLRRDPDNVCAGIKFIADALVETGRIPNDTREFVREINHVFELPDKQNPRIEVEITEFK